MLPVVTEKIVYFAFDNSNINIQAEKVLDEVSKLTGNSNYTISIEGHGDHIGTAEYNHKLSLERAEAVKNYLISKGLSEASITTKGEGEANPIASNDTEAGRALNRRAKLTIKVITN